MIRADIGGLKCRTDAKCLDWAQIAVPTVQPVSQTISYLVAGVAAHVASFGHISDHANDRHEHGDHNCSDDTCQQEDHDRFNN